MAAFGSISVSKDGLTESLCDGLTKRIFADLAAYEQQFIASVGAAGQFSDSLTLLTAEIPMIHGGQFGDTPLSKKQASTRLVNLFIDSIYVDVNAMGIDYPFKSKVFPACLTGFSIVNSRLALSTLVIDAKKPTRSTIGLQPILFSKHAVSRIIYRFKPRFLTCDLITIVQCINSLMLALNENIKSEYWLPIIDVGSFLLRRDEECADVLHVVTFVDENKLTQVQKNDGIELLSLLRSFDTNLSNIYEQGVIDMKSHRAIADIMLPKAFIDN